MKNITFNEQINLFWKSKAKEIPRLHTQESTCVGNHDAYARRPEPARACRVLETMKDKFSVLKIEVWNESHIVWEPFQTFIFTI